MPTYDTEPVHERTGKLTQDLNYIYEHEKRQEEKLAFLLNALDGQNIPGLEDLKRIAVKSCSVAGWQQVTAGEFYNAGYIYCAEIRINGCTPEHTGDVILSPQTAAAGNIAPVFETMWDSIKIYSKTADPAEIMRIEVRR